MRNSFRCSLSLLPCLALALLAARPAKADLFDISGFAVNASGGTLGSCTAGETCPFSGTLTVNVTLGTVDALNITFPGLPAFDTIFNSFPVLTPGWEIDAHNSSNDELDLLFSTTPTPGSLVGFDGGTLIRDAVFQHSTELEEYVILSGSITPVPEPSSLGELAAALLAFAGVIGLRKSKPVVTK
jgi:hypothetical protein